ncbi:hypothetical protein GJ496_007345 [Pomphorhynchus laevis]|nr:hypothetical protein GJ496_007345 [Pomphorhynchus laevis]
MIPNSANLSLTNSNESSQHAQTNNEHANGKIAKCKLDKADQSCELQQECNGSIDKQDSANKDNEVSFADKRIKDEFKKEKHAAKQLAEQLKLLQVNDNKPSEWKFWSTQPVVMNPVEKVFNEPIQSNVDETKIRKDPICLPEGFSWSVINVDDNKELLEVYFLLNENYVQDDDNMFRFDYSKDFLKWALCSPGWLSDWHVGIRATKSKKLLGFISGVPATIQIRGK